MIPRTLSASSIQTFQLCPTRWKEEYIDRNRGWSNSAADTGTSVHGGLEMYVKAVYIDKTHQPSLDLLISFYQMSYMQTFKTADMETEEYHDGLNMTKKWFKRTRFDYQQCVESVELKETIKIPYNHPDGTVHELDFNYLMDRVDQLGSTEWEVVDYKTIRVPLQPDDLVTKVQARAYALAIQIKHPEATQVKVTFDQLRHDPITIRLTREDNVAFWRYLCATVQSIVDLDEKDVRPTLNPECGYCPVKYTCDLMIDNIAAGGYHSLDMADKVELLQKLQSQVKANKNIIDELTESMFIYAAQNDTLEWLAETSTGKEYFMEVGASRRRKFPAHEAARIMGPDLFAQMGSMTIGNLEKIIKDESLDAEMRQQLADLMQWQTGDFTLKMKEKKTL